MREHRNRSSPQVNEQARVVCFGLLSQNYESDVIPQREN